MGSAATLALLKERAKVLKTLGEPKKAQVRAYRPAPSKGPRKLTPRQRRAASIAARVKRAWRRARGLCPYCDNPLGRFAAMCDTHADQHRQRQRLKNCRTRWAWVEGGLGI